MNLIKRYITIYKLDDIEVSEVVDNLVYYIINRMVETIKQIKPDIVIVCSDNGKNQRARAITDGAYKANRNKYRTLTAEEHEHSIINYLTDIIKTLPFPFLELKDTEADMIIYNVVDYLKKLDNNINITLYSGDSDFLQLLDKNVDILDWKKDIINLNNFYNKHDKTFDNQYFYEKNYALAKSITGDISDNIKGVERWGWKKTIKLFTYLYKYYNNKIEVNNVNELISLVNDLIYGDYKFTKKDISFLETSLKMLKENSKLIDNNHSIIDLTRIETPFIFQIMSLIKRELFENNIKFNRQEFIKLLKLERFKDNIDNTEYEQIKAKNSKSAIEFMNLDKKINKNIKILKNRIE